MIFFSQSQKQHLITCDSFGLTKIIRFRFHGLVLHLLSWVLGSQAFHCVPCLRSTLLHPTTRHNLVGALPHEQDTGSRRSSLALPGHVYPKLAHGNFYQAGATAGEKAGKERLCLWHSNSDTLSTDINLTSFLFIPFVLAQNCLWTMFPKYPVLRWNTSCQRPFQNCTINETKIKCCFLGSKCHSMQMLFKKLFRKLRISKML